MNIAFVPVRCGSKSIPFKNIKLFCGKPLVYWSLLVLQNSENVDVVYLATDCTEIKQVVNSFDFSKVIVYDRNPNNATDTATTESVMLEFINSKKFSDEDLFLLVQATSPLMQTKDVDGSINQFQIKNCDSLLTCVRTKRFFWNDKNIPINYDYKNRPRRQDFEGLLMENGALYMSTVGEIKDCQNRLSGNISVYEMDECTAVELDEDDDWVIAESLMYKNILNKDRSTEIKVFLTDVDGTLTDAGMYYGEDGNEFKKFNTRDGKGFEILRKAGIKTGIITSENTKIVSNRAEKLKVDYLYQGVEHQGKLEVVKEICRIEGVELENIAYIGDDLNCKDLLIKAGLSACPSDAIEEVKLIPGIRILSKSGGSGAVREFIDCILNKTPKNIFF
jgi:YrbI family 3-deoxy-D-manno-octulosonate 8-phosphate phosphatase